VAPGSCPKRSSTASSIRSRTIEPLTPADGQPHPHPDPSPGGLPLPAASHHVQRRAGALPRAGRTPGRLVPQARTELLPDYVEATDAAWAMYEEWRDLVRQEQGASPYMRYS
jgi:hypothetical protein